MMDAAFHAAEGDLPGRDGNLRAGRTKLPERHSNLPERSARRRALEFEHFSNARARRRGGAGARVSGLSAGAAKKMNDFAIQEAW
jgi:hypothetical protein